MADAGMRPAVEKLWSAEVPIPVCVQCICMSRTYAWHMSRTALDSSISTWTWASKVQVVMEQLRTAKASQYRPMLFELDKTLAPVVELLKDCWDEVCNLYFKRKFPICRCKKQQSQCTS